LTEQPVRAKTGAMKSAYELAMERLNKPAPSMKLNAAQKKELAELDSLYASKVAQREIFLKGELAKAEADVCGMITSTPSWNRRIARRVDGPRF
jgi:hypothetical protein